jgi:prephenate dehydratase
VPRASYLGPDGTHTGEAARACDLLAEWELMPEPGIRAAFERFARRDADAAVLPLENVLEGSVGATLDLLASAEGEGIRIRREIVRPIAHALAGPASMTGEAIGVVSHPQALAQCARSIAERFPRAQLEAASSTAAAAQLAAGRRGWLAIAPREAAERAGLAILADDLSDEPGNRTRFVVLMREDERPTGRDRTSIVFGLDRDRPGALHAALGELASRGINLSRIESRPTRRALGEYWFFADLEAHREEPAAAEALAALARGASFFRNLGSYPRATA